MRHRWLVLAPVLVSLVALLPGASIAQVGEVWVEPRVGWSVPTRELGSTDILGNVGYGNFERARGTPSLGVGAGVGLGSGWALRAVVDRALDAAVDGEWRCAPLVACPSVLLPLRGELTRWAAGLDVLLRPATRLPVRAVLFAGLGLRRTAVGWDQPEADVVLPALSFHETGLVARLGVGVEGSVGPGILFGEVGASASRFGGGSHRAVEGEVGPDPHTGVDIGVMAGMRIPLG